MAKLFARLAAVAAAGTLIAASSVAGAQDMDTVKVASAQRGLWTTTLVYFGNEKGIFEKHGLNLEIHWADGGANTQQAVISGAADVAVATGTLGAITAWARGAPVQIIASDFTGGSDLFWYVRGDSEIEKVADLDGHSVSFSRPGSSSHLMAQGVVDNAGVDAEMVPTGGPSATLTAVMSGQVDVGWTAPPTVEEELANGKIRLLFTGNDAPGISDQSVRVDIANRAFLEEKEEVAKRFLAALKETIDWAYDTDEAVEMWAQMHDVSVEVAKAARDRGYPRSAMVLKPVSGVDLSIEQAVASRRLDAPLTDAQVTEMLKWVDMLNK
ncbi:ABC transporter substrate-binding protein [Amorphus sp. 3PC139-8]|uniref:ABC transporter substrate-binding protein n=1 Tax=Amorphus sp. 3PC139-8 TaxID=2735676 RepID=UPI00345CBB3E